VANTHPIKNSLMRDGPLAQDLPFNMAGQKFFNQNFRGMDFAKRDLRRCTFLHCCFDDADLTEADCTGSEFHGSTLRNTICRNTNFTLAKLHGTVFEPSDFYGMTMTFVCETFQDMKMARNVWNGYVFFALGLIKPPLDDDGFDPRHALIESMGREYFLEHFRKFKDRTL
jgi:hypothetical protein